MTAWGTHGRLVKNVLEILFAHGRVLITARKNFRRIYDLPERVLPPHILHAPPAPAAEVARWGVLLRLRQRRLATLTREDVRLVEDAVQRVVIENCPPLYCLREDVPLLEASISDPSTPSSLPSQRRHQTLSTSPALLAPLDPLIYDRRVTAALWNFDYTWEVYTPAAKRVRGYYALPVLADTELVGHVDLKADRGARKLIVVSRAVRRGVRVAPALREFAAWVGLCPPLTRVSAPSAA